MGHFAVSESPFKNTSTSSLYIDSTDSIVGQLPVMVKKWKIYIHKYLWYFPWTWWRGTGSERHPYSWHCRWRRTPPSRGSQSCIYRVFPFLLLKMTNKIFHLTLATTFSFKWLTKWRDNSFDFWNLIGFLAVEGLVRKEVRELNANFFIDSLNIWKIWVH